MRRDGLRSVLRLRRLAGAEARLANALAETARARAELAATRAAVEAAQRVADLRQGGEADRLQRKRELAAAELAQRRRREKGDRP